MKYSVVYDGVYDEYLIVKDGRTVQRYYTGEIADKVCARLNEKENNSGSDNNRSDKR
mgnify:CR=1 FL=1